MKSRDFREGELCYSVASGTCIFITYKEANLSWPSSTETPAPETKVRLAYVYCLTNKYFAQISINNLLSLEVYNIRIEEIEKTLLKTMNQKNDLEEPCSDLL